MDTSDSSSGGFDPKAFRDALGSFATGVAIVTTQSAACEDVGITANSFNSVSLDPPMILWSLSRKALSLPSFQQTPYFAVHILAADQDGLSRRFATRGENKFAGLEIARGFGGVPLIDGCAARFQCHTAFNYDGGDHVIFVGEVLEFDSFERQPLLFHAGRYALAVEKASGEPQDGQDRDYLFGLLGRAHNQMYLQIHNELGRAVLSDSDRSVLSLLGASGHDGDAAGSDAPIRRLVNAALAAEEQSASGLQPGELRILKQLLRKLVGEGA